MYAWYVTTGDQHPMRLTSIQLNKTMYLLKSMLDKSIQYSNKIMYRSMQYIKLG